MEIWLIFISASVIFSIILALLDYNLLHYLYKDPETPSIIANLFFLPIFIGSLFFWFQFDNISAISFWFVAWVCTFISSYLYSLSYAAKIPPGTTLGIYKVQMVFAFLVGIFFLGEHLTHTQFIWHGIIFLGAILLSLEHFTWVEKKILLLLPFIGAIFYSIGLVINDIAYISLDFITVFGSFAFWNLVGVPVLIFCTKKGRMFFHNISHNWKKYLYLGTIAELINLGDIISFHLALKYGPLTLVVFLKEMYVVILILLSLMFGYFYPRYFPDGGQGFSYKKLCIISWMLGGVFLALS